MECYLILPNARVRAFSVSKLLGENPKGSKKTPAPTLELTENVLNYLFYNLVK